MKKRTTTLLFILLLAGFASSQTLVNCKCDGDTKSR